jgi:hypothetical protein
VNERLAQINNFLSAEDPNRHYEFREKLAEIDEYLDFVRDEKIVHDTKLFRDARIMLEVHHDWDRGVKEKPPDTVCCDAPSINQVSNRLISRKEAIRCERTRQHLAWNPRGGQIILLFLLKDMVMKTSFWKP